MSKAFDHLTSVEREKKDMPLDKDSEIVSLQADVAALKFAMEENKKKDIIILDHQSTRFVEFREVECKVDTVINNLLDSFATEKNLISKEKIEMCGALLNLVDRYRNTKVQSELLKFTKFSTSPIVQ